MSPVYPQDRTSMIRCASRLRIKRLSQIHTVLGDERTLSRPATGAQSSVEAAVWVSVSMLARVDCLLGLRTLVQAREMPISALAARLSGVSALRLRALQLSRNVRFSNRPFEVKHFQTIRHCNVDVAHGLALLFGIGTRGPFHHGIRG